MKPEEAQELTEKRWLAIISDPTGFPPACGWCLFAIGMTIEDMSHCHKCPVVRVFGDSCMNIPEYDEWDRSGAADSARKVYDLLIAHRDQLIAAAKEIENEQNIRD